MEVEELLALLIGWLGRAGVQRILSGLVNRALDGAPLSSAHGGACRLRRSEPFDADELGIYDDDEETACQD